MAWLGRANEIVVGDIERLPKIKELASDAIDKLLRSHPCRFGIIFDLLAVFVQTG